MPSVAVAVNIDMDRLGGPGGTPPVTSAVLMEDGTDVLMEDGTQVLME